MNYDPQARRRRLLKGITHSPLYLALLYGAVLRQQHDGLTWLSTLDELTRRLYIFVDVAPDLAHLYAASLVLGPASFYAYGGYKGLRVFVRKHGWSAVRTRALAIVGAFLVAVVVIEHADWTLLQSDLEALAQLLPDVGGVREAAVDEAIGPTGMVREYYAESAKRYPVP
jgi:hypothetical protein